MKKNWWKIFWLGKTFEKSFTFYWQEQDLFLLLEDMAHQEGLSSIEEEGTTYMQSRL